MKKWFAFVWMIGLVRIVVAQEVPTPSSFLGYTLGAKFTRHHRIVDYCKAVATANPMMVKFEEYGQTYEGRVLGLCIISSADNMQRLEGIRKNNLRLAGLAKDKMMPITDSVPAIVWLSYNVHGNEPASSEAAMLTLYELAAGNNAKRSQWLQNTVVIIDPCLNPDGRDRYVNWYNGVVGKQSNAFPAAREHSEPWPQGRGNHYGFDLNRDWAWQTQQETQARIAKYQQWMPQIHVDYHEQGYNDPYYFAPAAQPMHDVITPWQRSFQTLIGKKHAAIFDEKGWLYFTKERFDLFYPAYGDTYPTYSGSIGMTYEQAGIRAGLAIKNAQGDTLTLEQRIMHHHATGLSTIATASAHAKELIQAFQLFFNNSKQAKGFTYKTYVLTANAASRLKAIEQLLTKNGIEYGVLATGLPAKAYNYNTKKEEVPTLQRYHIAINLQQPRSVLASVLLEPNSRLVDSITYDITAWSLPYAHGLQAYAMKEALAVKPMEMPTENKLGDKNDVYGLLVKYQSIESAKVLAQLLAKGVKVRFAEKPFSCKGINYKSGTLIVLKNGNTITDFNWAKTMIAAALPADETAIVEGGMMDAGVDFGSPDVKLITKQHIAVLTGDQVSSLDAGEVWHFFDETLNYPVSMLNAADWQQWSLKEVDVLILPEGRYQFPDKGFADKLKEFVRNGGKLIAMQNAVNVLGATEWALKAKEDKGDDGVKDEYSGLKKYANREKEYVTNNLPGAVFKVELDTTHPLAFGYDDQYYCLKQDGGLYEFLKEGWNVGVIKKESLVTGFAGNALKPKLKDALIYGVQDAGSGTIVYLNDNPLFRQFWENGKLLFCNAVFLTGR